MFLNVTGNNDNLFSIKVNYAGVFTSPPGMRYVNGNFIFFDTVDIEEFSIHELNDMVKKLGYSANVIIFSISKNLMLI